MKTDIYKMKEANAIVKGGSILPAKEMPQDVLVKQELAASGVPLGIKKTLNKTECIAINSAVGGQIWWFCDTCLRGIQPGEPRYECRECLDFCQCRKCHSMLTHPHTLKKKIVPKGC